MRHNWQCDRLAQVLLVFTLAGCADEFGPETWQTTRVSGVVREGLRPVAGGWVEFLPVEGTHGNLRVGPIQPDGTFHVDGVAVGRNMIMLAHAPIVGAYAGRFQSAQGAIRRDIPAGSETVLKLDLMEEAMKSKAIRVAPRVDEPARPE